MAFLVKDKNEILRQALRKLELNTAITSTGPGSVARSLVEVMTTELGDFYNVLDFNMALNVVSTASGRALDLLGKLYNTERKTLNNIASIDKSLGSFYFYLDSPYIGTITIPSGTRITTDNTSFVGDFFTYTTTENSALPPGRTKVWVTIQPLTADSIFTCGVGTLTVHNVVTPAGVVLKCTNPKQISPQISFEDDESYRDRIIKGVRTAAGGTGEAFRMGVLAVQGVRDVTIRESPYGLGSAEAIVVTEDAALSGFTLQLIKAALNTIKPVGTRVFVRPPKLLPVEIQASIVLRKVRNLDEGSIARRAEIGILRYLNKMLVGTTLSYNQLMQAIFDSSDLILDITINGMQIDGQEILRRNFTPAGDEQLIPGNIQVVASVSE